MKSLTTLLISLLALAASATADTLPTLVFSSTQPNLTSCAAPPAQTNFSASGANIYEYFVVGNMKPGDTVSALWINPNSQTILTNVWPKVTVAGNYCWHGAYLTQSEYWYTPGTWHLRIQINNQYLGQGQFTVTPSWQTMSQQQRNQAIITAGLAGYALDSAATTSGGQKLYYSGMDCKVWAQHIVSVASNSAVSLPQTEPDLYQWYQGPNVVAVSTSLANLQPGWILQLELAGKTPHTAIVLSASPAEVVLLDSNWVGGLGADDVGVHSMTTAQFNNAFVRYTAYEIM
jgi:hypothetical protein